MVDNTRDSNKEQQKNRLRNFLSINDLKDKEYSNAELSHEERLALKNFDRYRIAELNSQPSEKAFQSKYFQLQAMANLSPYNEFLKEDYFG